jgi:hypothetical protein
VRSLLVILPIGAQVNRGRSQSLLDRARSGYPHGFGPVQGAFMTWHRALRGSPPHEVREEGKAGVKLAWHCAWIRPSLSSLLWREGADCRAWLSAYLDPTARPVELRRSHEQVRCHRRDPRAAGEHVDRVRAVA